MNAPAYPLQWPVGRQRTKYRERSKFRMTEAAITDHLFNNLEAMGATGVIISTNRAPYSRSRSQPEDPGAAVYFVRKNQNLCIACDKWDKIEDNIHAVGLAVEAIRGFERWGTGDMVDAAFSGFTALPAGGSAIIADAPWWEILGLGPQASKEDVKTAFNKLAHKAHPDRGGSTEEFTRLRNAYEQGIAQ